jgi:hypothetical protein
MPSRSPGPAGSATVSLAERLGRHPGAVRAERTRYAEASGDSSLAERT